MPYTCAENRSHLKAKQGFGRPAELELHKIGPRDRLCGSCHWLEEQENQHKCSLTCSFPSADEVEVGHFNCKGCSEHKEVKKVKNEARIFQNCVHTLLLYCHALEATKRANFNVILKSILIFLQTSGRAYEVCCYVMGLYPFPRKESLLFTLYQSSQEECSEV